MSLYEGAEDAKRVLSADNMDQMALLFGALDENVETVQQRTGARIRAMGTEITVTGTQEQWKKYIEIIIRLYCSCQVEMPSGFTRMINDDEEFQAYGYAFVLGLRGSYFETGKKDDENKQEESN